MKKYKKPIIDTARGLSVDSFMVSATVDGGAGPGNGGPGSGGGDAKFRDEEMEDEALMQLLIEQENGNTSNLW